MSKRKSNQILTASEARYREAVRTAGVPRDQLERFLRAGYMPQPKQLLFHGACRLSDQPNGPTEIGFGGARGPGKSHASFAQIALDDCQRIPGLKFLFLRKVAKAAKESFEDLRLKVLGRIPHEYVNNIIRFPNGSRIIFGHFRTEGDIDNYLGIEYDGVVIEESTQLTLTKKKQIKTCVRTSKQNWRPRMYHTTNPGGVGHLWFKQAFIEPFRRGEQTVTRFVPATSRDNMFLNSEYTDTLNELTGWLLNAWRDGDWDIAAGQYFSTWNYDKHTCAPFTEIPSHWPVWGGFDYGFTHPTAFYLLTEFDGKVYVIGEHVEARALPAHHATQMRALAAKFGRNIEQMEIFAGTDVFQNRGDEHGRTIAMQYQEHGITFHNAITDRPTGWAEILRLLGDPMRDVNPLPPQIAISRDCVKLIECIPALQHNPNKPEDVLKWDVDDEGNGGDDPADAFRYACMARLSDGQDYATGGSRRTL